VTAFGGRRVARRQPPAPERMESARILYRRPRAGDAALILAGYASDPDVTRYLAWPRHTSLDDTRIFLAFSDGEWRTWGCGPYLMFSRDAGELLGSTGLAFETSDEASTGYVLVRGAWGHGYATEALVAMRELARELGVRRLYAVCHTSHQASRHVMEKGGLTYDGVLTRHTVFPNLGPDRCDVLSYSLTFDRRLT
jgi:RimJ/RimL family protein N-acetyltransferase